MRKHLLIFISLVLILPLQGCWNYREINTTVIVAGLAIDKNDDDSYHLTAEVIDIGGSPNESKLISKRIEAYGNTLFEAVRGMIQKVGRRLFWSHAQVVIISEKVAKDGVLPIMDFYARNDELRLSTCFIVSKEKTAKEILSQEGITEKIISYSIMGMLDEHTSNITIHQVNVKEFINNYNRDISTGTMTTIEIVENDNKKGVKLSGISMFKEDRFIDYLDLNHTRSYLFIRDEINKGVYPIKVTNSEGKIEFITLEIMNSKTKIQPKYENNQLTLSIKLQTQVGIAALGNIKSTLDKESRIKLKEIIEKQIKQDITNTIQLLQNEYGLDIFGFDTIIKANLPNLWKEIGKDWEIYFKELDIKIEPKIEIKNSSLLIKDIKGE